MRILSDLSPSMIRYCVHSPNQNILKFLFHSATCCTWPWGSVTLSSFFLLFPTWNTLLSPHHFYRAHLHTLHTCTLYHFYIRHTLHTCICTLPLLYRAHSAHSAHLHTLCTCTPAHFTTFIQGTPSHMAPEVRSHGKLFQSSDAFSFGILLWCAPPSYPLPVLFCSLLHLLMSALRVIPA